MSPTPGPHSRPRNKISNKAYTAHIGASSHCTRRFCRLRTRTLTVTATGPLARVSRLYATNPPATGSVNPLHSGSNCFQRSI